jgi:hypothetical protein
MQALKEFTLMGTRYQSGSPIPESAWGQCDVRLRMVLTRNRFVKEGSLRPTPQPVVAVYRKRGRPRKEG